MTNGVGCVYKTTEKVETGCVCVDNYFCFSLSCVGVATAL